MLFNMDPSEEKGPLSRDSGGLSLREHPDSPKVGNRDKGGQSDGIREIPDPKVGNRNKGGQSDGFREIPVTF